VGLAHRGTWPGLANGLSPFGPRPKQGKLSPTGAAAVAGDEVPEAGRGEGARVRWRGGEPNLGFWMEGGSPVWAHSGGELGGI
jgi:hypothetical protein